MRKPTRCAVRDTGSAAPSGPINATATGTAEFDTRAGTLDLAIHKLRQGSYFPDWLLERRKRAERALTTVVATCYLLGVSTRRMDKLVETLGITSLSKSQVSRDGQRTRRHGRGVPEPALDAGPYTFMAADALVLKVREGGRVVNVHALIAVGVNAEGYREILGIDVTTAEDGAGWLRFLRSRTARGLSGVRLVTSDAQAGLVAAIGASLPGAAWQRCRTHYTTNLMAVTPKASWPWVRTLLHSVFDQPDAAIGCRSIGSDHRRADRQAPEGCRSPRSGLRGSAGVHRVPQGDLAPDLVQQPPGATQQGDPAAHRRRRHLPRPQRTDPPRRRRAGRTTRRMGRIPPLPRPGRPQQIPSRERLTDRTGGHPSGTNRLNHYLEESHNDVIHHVWTDNRSRTAFDANSQRAGGRLVVHSLLSRRSTFTYGRFVAKPLRSFGLSTLPLITSRYRSP